LTQQQAQTLVNQARQQGIVAMAVMGNSGWNVQYMNNGGGKAGKRR